MSGSQGIMVTCPRCQKTGLVQVPTEIIQDAKGLSIVLIRAGVTCDHSYQVFLDKQYKVRGYQKTDYEVLLGPQPSSTSPKKTAAPNPEVILALRVFLPKIDTFIAANVCAQAILDLHNSIQSQWGFHPVLPDMKNWINQLRIGATWDAKTKDIVRKRVAFWIEKAS